MIESINSLYKFEESEDPDERILTLLDAPGYDSLSKNSLEQLCINLANEKIFESVFSVQVLEKEKKQLLEEGLNLYHIGQLEFDSNADLIKNLESDQTPKGLLKLISSISQKSMNYKAFITDLQKMVTKTKHFSQRQNKKGDEFAIDHSFYKVEYDPSSFLQVDRNQKLEKFFLELMKQKNPIMHKMLHQYTEVLADKRYDSYGDQFIVDCNSMIKDLGADVSYVFNLRQKEKNGEEKFNQHIVIPQLKKFGRKTLNQASRAMLASRRRPTPSGSSMSTSAGSTSS